MEKLYLNKAAGCRAPKHAPLGAPKQLDAGRMTDGQLVLLLRQGYAEGEGSAKDAAAAFEAFRAIRR